MFWISTHALLPRRACRYRARAEEKARGEVWHARPEAGRGRRSVGGCCSTLCVVGQAISPWPCPRILQILARPPTPRRAAYSAPAPRRSCRGEGPRGKEAKGGEVWAGAAGCRDATRGPECAPCDADRLRTAHHAPCAHAQVSALVLSVDSEPLPGALPPLTLLPACPARLPICRRSPGAVYCGVPREEGGAGSLEGADYGASEAEGAGGR